MGVKVKFGWDKGVKYEEVKDVVTEVVRKYKDDDRIRSVKKLAYAVIAAIQLRNGARCSEACEAFENFVSGKFETKDGKRVTYVRVRKKKDEVFREIYYPEFVAFDVIKRLKNYKLEISTKAYKVACPRLFKVNTHSLRYARITWLLERGVNPSIVAKITKHSKLDFILDYTQEKIAEKVNKELV